jgi:hypothetical protein
MAQRYKYCEDVNHLNPRRSHEGEGNDASRPVGTKCVTMRNVDRVQEMHVTHLTLAVLLKEKGTMHAVP